MLLHVIVEFGYCENYTEVEIFLREPRERNDLLHGGPPLVRHPHLETHVSQTVVSVPF